MQSRIVKSTGPTPCSILIVAERPGIVEHKKGYCLCGPSGQEFDRYLLNDAGLYRGNVHCTNLVRDYRDGENPSPEEVERDLPLLLQEIGEVQPQYIGLVGLFAARALMGDLIDLEWSHGLCFPGEGVKLMPLIHPAAGLHQPRYAAQIAWDFVQFGEMCKNRTMSSGHLEDAYPNPMYIEQTGRDRVRADGGPVAVDTEGTWQDPWGVSYSRGKGTACVARHGLVDIGEAILHGAIHDLPVLEALGVHIGTFTDTLQAAALLGTEPLSLKSLSRRWAGMDQREYADVVRMPQRQMALEYLLKVQEYAKEKVTG